MTAWSPDPNSSLQQNVTTVKAAQIRQLRTKLEEALTALHLPVGGYAHAGPDQGDPIYAIDFQELRNKIKDAWTSLAATSSLSQFYDGDGLRVKRNEYGWTTFYLRSSVLGGQVVAEIDGNAVWQRGYVYAGSSLMAVQQSGVFWMHEDPVTKGKRTTDVSGNVVSSVELDPWGADTSRSSSTAFQPRKFTTYDRDGNGSDEAMFRRYNRKNSRFDQPDPYEGSYDLSSPQSFNRYSYTQNDPVNFIDPAGLDAGPPNCGPGMVAKKDGKGDWQCVGTGVSVVTVTGSWDDMSGYLPSWTSNDVFIRILLIGGGPQNSFPTLTKDDLKVVQDSINLAQEMTKDKKCDEALKAYGIPSLAALINGMTPNGNLFDGRSSTLTGPIGKNGATESMAAYFKDNKTSVGAAVFNNSVTGRGSVTFLGDYFFNPVRMDWVAFQRAIIMMHESVHQVGGKGDALFGSSKQLSEKIIEKCYPVLKGKLGGVG